MNPERNKIIGGVFALEQTMTESRADSVWARWTESSESNFLFHNARSALAHVVEQKKSPTLWMPAYICSELATLTFTCSTKITFYPIDKQLIPDTSFLKQNIKPGDIVLIVNFFGRPNPDSLRTFIETQPAVTWIEDSAQAFDTGQEPMADIRIYSPRKLLGVPDGGLLVDFFGTTVAPKLCLLRNKALFLKPSQTRAAQTGRARNDLWFPEFKHAENRMCVSLEASDPITKKILDSVDLSSISNARKRNYLYLHEKLSEFALFSAQPLGWVPLGFPMLINKKQRVLEAMFQNNVFAASHWANIKAPLSTFSLEHSISQSLITLPCDQRYNLNDMQRMVSIVRSHIS